jgi:putative aldouronate transport system permease protein
MRFVIAKKKLQIGSVVFNTINYSVFILFTLICIYPFYYLFINSISSNSLSAAGKIIYYPIGIHFSNYIDIMKLPGLANGAIISLLRTVIGTTCTVGASAFLGFAFTKKEMWGRKFCYRFVIVTMYFNAGLIPIYINMMNLHLTNNFLSYILPVVVSPFNIILVKTYIESLPISLQEAAEIDGAGFAKIFASIIFPIITPILATITVFSAVGQWNSFQDTLLYMTDSRLYTLQYLLYRYINQSSAIAQLLKDADPSTIGDLLKQQTPDSVRMTVSMVVIIPILMVYPYFQKYFVKGIMIGAVKG